MGSLLLVAVIVLALAAAQALLWGIRSTPDSSIASATPARQAADAAQVPGWASWPFFDGLYRLQEQSGTSKPTRLVLLPMGILALVGAWFGDELGGGPMAAIGAAAGAALPSLWLLRGRQNQTQRINHELPAVLASLVRLTQSGHGAASACLEASREHGGVLGVELARVHGRLTAGIALRPALDALATRYPLSLDLRMVATAMSLADETGGDLGTLLARIEGSIRTRIELEQQARVESTQARMSALMLSAMPPIGVVALWLVQPDYLQGAWDDPVGRVMFQSAGLWMLLGMALVAHALRRMRL